MASRLGLTKGALSNHKKRGTIPLKKIQIYCEEVGLSLDALIGIDSATGKEFSFKKENGRPTMDELWLMAKTVLEKGGDNPYCRALTENIRAFFRAVAAEERIEAHPIFLKKGGDP